MAERKIAIVVLDTDLDALELSKTISGLLGSGLPPETFGRVTVFDAEKTDSVDAIEAALREKRPVIFKPQGS